MREAKTVVSAKRRSALIAGGGIVGLACAHRLLQRGLSVTILDRAGTVRPPSWGNAGVIAVNEVEPLASRASLTKALRLMLRGNSPVSAPIADFRTWLPFFIRMAGASGSARFRSGTAALTACMERALPAWREMLDEIGRGAMLLESGHLVVWESARTARTCLTAWQHADTGPASFRAATEEEMNALQALTGKRPCGAIRFQGTAHISDPGRLLDALKNSIVSAGADFVAARAEVITATRQQKATLIADDGSSHTADAIVIASGVGSGRLLQQAGAVVPMIAERGYHVQSPVNGWPGEMPPIVFEDRAIVVTGFESALRATSFVEFARHDRPATQARWERLERHLDELGLPFGSPRSRWMGARPTLPDYLPAIGKSGFADNLYYAFGHQHLGLTMAPVTAEIIADLVLERSSSIDLRPFDIARFSKE